MEYHQLRGKGHQTAVVNEDLILFGGTLDTTNYNDQYVCEVFIFNFESETWKRVEASGSTPQPRMFHSMMSYPRQKPSCRMFWTWDHDLKNLFIRQELCDVVVKNEIKAHSCILKARVGNAHFRYLINPKEMKNYCKEKVPDCEPDFELIPAQNSDKDSQKKPQSIKVHKPILAARCDLFQGMFACVQSDENSAPDLSDSVMLYLNSDIALDLLDAVEFYGLSNNYLRYQCISFYIQI
ncbi:leucine-zipper-like transcriptional regulator 1 [Anaeramoeba ignava]|uniref:Leucine-zipper-like transcriptional regulator 1 n=1 Tax=Anaeramoeba ignava TaxID=1746090 RepID=A0A9Q0LU22_ANAIG|nr:leucine-zipper-like transcriptional regulator 1 [Anaeramoeba ignava]